MSTVNLPQKVGGFYTLRVHDAITGELKKEVGPFHNKITDLGLNRFGTGPVVTHAYVGTGTTPAAFTDTTMAAFKVAAANTGPGDGTTTSASVGTPYCSRTYVRRFPAGAIDGNITEVGVGWSGNPLNTLWSRELIVDSSGNPITLTVLANEYLDIVYTIRYYIDLTDTTGSFVLNNVTYNYTLRTALLGSSSVTLFGTPGAPVIEEAYTAGATLGAVTGQPSGTRITLNSSISYGGYANNSLTLTGTTSFPTNGGNAAGGILAFFLSTGTGNVEFGGKGLNQYWQVLLDKAIPKTSANTMSITFARSWGRY